MKEVEIVKYNCEEEFWISMCMYTSFVDEVEIQKTGKFKDAIWREFDENETWELVPKTENTKILTIKWVLREKLNEKREVITKARLFARGFENIGTIQDLRAPVAKLSTLRVFLSICSYLHLDIQSQICKLGKTIYGLKEARIIRNRTINAVIVEANFKRSSNDYCFYIFREKQRVCYLRLSTWMTSWSAETRKQRYES